MEFALIDAEKAQFPVDFMCGELGVSRSGYYAWKGRAPSSRDEDDRELTAKVVVIHADSRQAYGTPRVQAQFRREGKNISRKRLSRLMATADLTTKRKRRFRRTTDSNHAFPVAENLLERRFTVERPDQVWVTDITYVWTGEGWLYLAALVDLYARRVVGWSMAEHMERQLCLDALEMACKARHPPPGLVHPSDRGSQYASTDYRQALEKQGMLCSMSRKGDCWDNAVAESFWSTLKAEVIDDVDFPTRAAARFAIVDYIEVFYNKQRLHSSLGFTTPKEKEDLYNQLPKAA